MAKCARLAVLLMGFMVLADPIVADLWVVDAGGGGDFIDIQAAVDAAGDGDGILVANGVYAGFTAGGASLFIAADRGAHPEVQGTVRVEGLATQRYLVLSGLSLRGVGSASNPDEVGPALFAKNCLGELRLSDCDLRGADGSAAVDPTTFLYVHPEGWDGALLDGCNSVIVEESVLQGGDGLDNTLLPGNCCGIGFSGGHGAHSAGSRLALYDCAVRGGDGSDSDLLTGAGGSGVRDRGITLYVSGGSVQGGDGGFAAEFIRPAGPGDGGPGIETFFASQVNHRDVLLAGGAGGSAPFVAPPETGADGLPIAGPGFVHQLPGSARGLTAPRLLRDGDTATFVLRGEPGELAVLLFGPTPAWIGLVPLQGVLVTPNPFLLLAGTVDGTGAAELVAAITGLPPELLGFTLHFQSAFVDALGGGSLGTPAFAAWM